MEAEDPQSRLDALRFEKEDEQRRKRKETEGKPLSGFHIADFKAEDRENRAERGEKV